MRKILIIFAFSTGLIFTFLSSGFSLEIGEQKVNITFSNSFVSRYIWRGLDLLPDNDPAYQPSVDVALEKLVAGADLSFNVWGSFPSGGGHEELTELDYSATLSRDFELFNLSSGFTHFDYVKANRYSDLHEIWMSASLFKIPILPVDVSFNVLAAYEFEAVNEGPEDGMYYSWGFSTSVPMGRCPLAQEEQTFDMAVTNWGNDGVTGLKPSALYATEITLSTSYAAGPVTITPGFMYVASHEKEINEDDEIAGTIDISYSF